MNALAKTGLVVGGLAFLFKDQILSVFETTPDPAPAPVPSFPAPMPVPYSPAPMPVPYSPAPTPVAYYPAPTPSAPAPPNTPANFTVAERVLTATGAGTRLNADQWNYYWTQASGVTQTTDLFPPENRAATMTLLEYISRRGTAGLSGLAVVGRRR